MAHRVYAAIYGGEVIRLMVGTEESCREAVAELYGIDADVVDVTTIPVQEGDMYDGRFWRAVPGGVVEVKPLPSIEEDLAAVRADLLDIDEAIVELYELMEVDA